MFQITRLKTEYMINPIGIDVRKPRFSWEFSGTGQDCLQTAYRVQVYAAGMNFAAPGAVSGGTDADTPVWDSERVDSDNSAAVVYEGGELTPCTPYRVKVTVWGRHRAPGE